MLPTSIYAQSAPNTTTEVETNISATIDKNTSDTDFNNIRRMLVEYDIEAHFNGITRNAQGEIIKVTISLASNSSQTQSKLSGNSPIQPIALGSNNGNLYIGNVQTRMDISRFFNGGNHFVSPQKTILFLASNLACLILMIFLMITLIYPSLREIL